MFNMHEPICQKHLKHKQKGPWSKAEWINFWQGKGVGQWTPFVTLSMNLIGQCDKVCNVDNYIVFHMPLNLLLFSAGRYNSDHYREDFNALPFACIEPDSGVWKRSLIPVECHSIPILPSCTGIVSPSWTIPCTVFVLNNSPDNRILGFQEVLKFLREYYIRQLKDSGEMHLQGMSIGFWKSNWPTFSTGLSLARMINFKFPQCSLARIFFIHTARLKNLAFRSFTQMKDDHSTVLLPVHTIVPHLNTFFTLILNLGVSQGITRLETWTLVFTLSAEGLDSSSSEDLSEEAEPQANIKSKFPKAQLSQFYCRIDEQVISVSSQA